MKTRRLARPRLWVEELEPRVVLSTLPGVQPVIVPSLISHTSLATTSTNWAGYAAQTNFAAPANSAVTAVSGSWTVPAVTGLAGQTTYSSVWVGIDGYSSTTVEQIGTEADWVNGVAVYYAWYEMYPKGSVSVTKLDVHANDSISASVTYVSGKFTLQITDNTTSKSFSTSQAAPTAKRSSAEWIVEAPSSNFGVLPLANFGTTTISNASATFSIAGKSTTGGIDNPAWQNTSINIVTAGNALAAKTGALTDSAGKSSFAVTFTAPATATPPPSRQHHWSWESNISDSTTMFIAPQDMVLARSSTFTVLNPNIVVAPPSPIGISAPPSVAQAPVLVGFRAFGLGSNEAPPNEVDAPMPPRQAPQAPNNAVPPAVVPPAGPGEISAIVEPIVEDVGVSSPMPAEVPSERRELRAGDVGRGLLAALGIVGVVSLSGEASTDKAIPDSDERRKPEAT